MASGTVHVGRTYRWQPVNGGVVLKDGAVWNLSTGSPTISLIFTKPNGTTVEVNATIDNAAAGIVHYDNDTSFFQAADVGVWEVTWRGRQGGTIDVILEQPIKFVLAA